LHALDADIPLGLICEVSAELATWKSLPIEYVIPHHRLVNENLVRTLHHEGKKVFVWTVNKREGMLQFRDMAVDGIISDDTSLLAELLRQ
jgi:glycerophosphoryl diester phosphodiesterase